MERMVESKKTKIILVLLILLAMLSSYIPSITFAGNDEENYVKFKSNWTSGTDEMDTLSNRTVYATFDMELSGSVVTGFRNVILRAEDYYETEEDENKP